MTASRRLCPPRRSRPSHAAGLRVASEPRAAELLHVVDPREAGVVVVAQAPRLVVDQMCAEPRQPVGDRREACRPAPGPRRPRWSPPHGRECRPSPRRPNPHRSAPAPRRAPVPPHRPVEPRPVGADDRDLVVALERRALPGRATVPALVRAPAAQVQVCQMPRSLCRYAGRSAKAGRCGSGAWETCSRSQRRRSLPRHPSHFRAEVVIVCLGRQIVSRHKKMRPWPGQAGIWSKLLDARPLGWASGHPCLWLINPSIPGRASAGPPISIAVLLMGGLPEQLLPIGELAPSCCRCGGGMRRNKRSDAAAR